MRFYAIVVTEKVSPKSIYTRLNEQFKQIVYPCYQTNLEFFNPHLDGTDKLLTLLLIKDTIFDHVPADQVM